MAGLSTICLMPGRLSTCRKRRHRLPCLTACWSGLIPICMIDLSARHFSPFFQIYRDIDFQTGAEECGLEVSIFFIIDRTEASIVAAAELCASLRAHPLHSGSKRSDWRCTCQWEKVLTFLQGMRVDREIILPELSAEAQGSGGTCRFPF